MVVKEQGLREETIEPLEEPSFNTMRREKTLIGK